MFWRRTTKSFFCKSTLITTSLFTLGWIYVGARSRTYPNHLKITPGNKKPYCHLSCYAYDSFCSAYQWLYPFHGSMNHHRIWYRYNQFSHNNKTPNIFTKLLTHYDWYMTNTPTKHRWQSRSLSARLPTLSDYEWYHNKRITTNSSKS